MRAMMKLLKKMRIVKEDDTGISEPPYLPYVDWSLPQHRRSVAACLVQATYLFGERSDALARPWYGRFGFKYIDKIEDDSDFSLFADYSIFGAIYKYVFPPTQENRRGNAPRYVIAFRGTQLKKETRIRDIQLDLRIAINIHISSRCAKAVNRAREIVADAGAENVWIAGHSLGATIATHAGKTLAVEGRNVKTFLFNPPFVTLPVHCVPSNILNQSFHIARDCLLWTIAAVKDKAEPSEAFARLSSWVPNIFVNKADVICSAYIGYFKHREIMGKFGADSLWKLGAEGSIIDVCSRFVGMESKALHLLPSANLTENRIEGRWAFVDLKAHSIHQWMDPDKVMPSKDYLYGSPP